MGGFYHPGKARRSLGARPNSRRRLSKEPLGSSSRSLRDFRGAMGQVMWVPTIKTSDTWRFSDRTWDIHGYSNYGRYIYLSIYLSIYIYIY